MFLNVFRNFFRKSVWQPRGRSLFDAQFVKTSVALWSFPSHPSMTLHDTCTLMQVIWNMFFKVYYGHSSPWMAGMSLLHMPQIAAARQWFQVSRKVRLVVCCVCISLCFWEACFIGGASNTCSWLSTNRCPLCRNHRNETYSMGRLTTRILFPHSAQDSQDILSISFGDSDSAKNSLENFEWCVVFGPSFASDSGLQFFSWRSTFS